MLLRIIHRGLAVAVCALLAATLGCGGQHVSSVRQPPSLSIPFPADRAASGLTEYVLTGDSADQRSAGAVDAGSAIVLSTTAGGFEYALYRFNPAGAGAGEMDSVRVLLEEAQTTGAWIALANFTTGYWDWQGVTTAGKTSLVDPADHLSVAGDLWVAVAAADGGSATINALSMRTINPANIPPAADLTSDIADGDAPLSVAFNAGLSDDSDGSIIEYAWDFDGDGLYDGFSDVAQLSHIFPSPGLFTVKVRVTDDQFARDTDTLDINVNVLGNSPPLASFTRSPGAGDAPLHVDFDAAASSDPDGGIARYDWDFDGDGAWDAYDSAPQMNHTYSVPGTYGSNLRVTDAAGAQDSQVHTVTVNVPANDPPVAAFTATPYSNPAPHDAHFDASGSIDSDGSIVLYEWDWEGDGSYDSTSSVPIVSHIFTGPGIFSSQLRVTDNLGATGTAQQLVPVPAVVVPDIRVAYGCAMVIANGRPAVFYADFENDGLFFRRAADAYGTAWGTEETVDFTNPSVGSLSAAIVDGMPAVAYVDSTTDFLRFSIGLNADGSAFDANSAVDTTVVGDECSLAVVNGHPAISYCDQTTNRLMYVRSSVVDGEFWNAPNSVDTSLQGYYNKLVVVNGRPAICYQDGVAGDLLYIRADNANGGSWPLPVTVDSDGTVGQTPSMAVVNGRPAITYRDTSDAGLNYVRAQDATGANWDPPLEVASMNNTDIDPSLRIIAGKPAIAYDDGILGVCYIAAQDVDGTLWDTPIVMDDDYASLCSLEVVSGKVAVAYAGGRGVRFARFY